MEVLLVHGPSDRSTRSISRLRASLKALIMHIVPLLLHVVGDVYLGHANLLATSDLELVIGLPLPHLGHLLASSVVTLSLLLHIVALSLLQESFLLNAAPEVAN